MFIYFLLSISEYNKTKNGCQREIPAETNEEMLGKVAVIKYAKRSRHLGVTDWILYPTFINQFDLMFRSSWILNFPNFHQFGI